MATAVASVELLYVTCPDEDTAARIGRLVVEEGLAACVNLLPGMRSIYRWQGRIEEARETVLVAKTSAPLVPAATARIVALHPYAVPCVLRLPVAGGYPPYLDWLTGAVNATPSG